MIHGHCGNFNSTNNSYKHVMIHIHTFFINATSSESHTKIWLIQSNRLLIQFILKIVVNLKLTIILI